MNLCVFVVNSVLRDLEQFCRSGSHEIQNTLMKCLSFCIYIAFECCFALELGFEFAAYRVRRKGEIPSKAVAFNPTIYSYFN
jgi:hypothetical protein